jgi:hypothetical protein
MLSHVLPPVSHRRPESRPHFDDRPLPNLIHQVILLHLLAVPFYKGKQSVELLWEELKWFASFSSTRLVASRWKGPNS